MKLHQWRRDLYRLLNLRRDQQAPELIDTALRDGVHIGGTNLWVLFFAILVASVGLNVNSTAVIIGAMLISPLMGPIVGIGYGAAVSDFPLVRRAARNLVVFALLSLVTSALYFLVSPLDEPQSELLARTSPTLWDVLIAAFGGAAGMIAATRRGYTNVMPGVAIATALMPPLCTAGFGLAHWRLDIFSGAFYLFLINGVFIAFSSLVIARILRLPTKAPIDPTTRQRHRFWLGVLLVAVMSPSLLFGWRLVQQEVFTRGALQVAQALERDGSTQVFSHEIDAPARVLRLTVLVGGQPGLKVERVQAMLEQQGISDARVELRRAGDTSLDIGQLRRELRDDLYKSLIQQAQTLEARVRVLEEAQAQSEASKTKTKP
jgi:uncharacterized hydrophobic protein (TIGR00271 family)